jgi:hypothetical protein
VSVPVGASSVGPALAQGAAVAQAVPVAVVAPAAGLVLAAGALAMLAGVLHRWYAGSAVPAGLATLLALSVVALDLNTVGSLQAVIGGDRGLLDLESVAFNGAVMLLAATVGPVAGRAGDALATAAMDAGDRRELRGGLGRLVASVGRATVVELPDGVEDIDGYDPVPPEVVANLAGETLTFPPGLDAAALQAALVDRLEQEYGVGHVDVEVAPDGTVERLAVGRRAAGVGATLPPGFVAVAVRADPAFSAGAGDRVLVYDPAPPGDPSAPAAGEQAATAPTEGGTAPTDGGTPPDGVETPPAARRVATAELRATAGDVVTLVVDAADAAALDDGTRYRLVTLPATPRVADEFAGLLRAADETMAAVPVADGSDVAGLPVGAVAATVVAVRPADGRVETLPARARTLAAGDTVYAVGRPETLRRLEAAAAA